MTKRPRARNDQSLTVTVPEAARIVGISTSKAYEAVRSGQIPSIRIGVRIVISRARLEAFINGADDRQQALMRRLGA